MKTFILNYHSFIDVITNSSSELFICSDKKIVNFIKELLKENGIENKNIIITTYGEHRKKWEPDEIIMSDETEIVLFNLNSEDDSAIYDLLTALGFKTIYD